MGAELAEQFRAEGVNGAAFDFRGGVAESSLEPMGDLTGGFVRERERADARRIEVQVFDEKVNALGEAMRFAGAGAGEDEQRAGIGFDRGALRRGDDERSGHGRRGSMRTVRVVWSKSMSTSSPAASCLKAGLSMK